MGWTDTLYSRLVRRNEAAESKLPEQVRADIPANGLRQVSALALQSSGDQTVNASTVLPWLFHALGVPVGLTGLLVPIRESGSMLPQAFLTPLVLRARHRKWVFVAGSLVQAVMVAVMAAAAALASGLTAGLVIIAALAVFSLGRCLCSMASKDVQGRTVPKGERGQLNGLSTTFAGLVAITLGLAIRVVGGEDLAPTQLAWLLAGGAALWVAVAAVYATIREPAGEQGAPTDDGTTWFSDTWNLLRSDAVFRRFVGVRSFLLVSSLSPPFIVTLSIQSGSQGLAGLGGFVIASGVASLLGGRLFGRQADRSSRDLMVRNAALASAVLLALVAMILLLDPALLPAWVVTVVFVGAYLLITLLHTGVRVGRKTYVVDIAEGDLRTTYVSVSNSAMGVVLLVVGAISSAIAMIGVVWALVFLAVLGILAVVAGRGLPDASH